MNTIVKPLNFSIVDEMYQDIEYPIFVLGERWEDERMYEDVGSYKNIVEKMMVKIDPEFAGNIEMIDRPFGFRFKVSNYTFKDGVVGCGEIEFTSDGWKTFKMKQIKAA